MDYLISKLSEIRSQYNCFDEAEEPYYRALSEAIKKLSEQADGDTISRQAAIDAADRADYTGLAVEDVKKVTDEVVKELKKLPSAQPEPQWIPCSERLPEDSQFVLMTIRRMDEHYNHEPFISVGYITWNQSLWWCAHDGDCEPNNVRVDAWMPLPEPYTKRREE